MNKAQYYWNDKVLKLLKISRLMLKNQEWISIDETNEGEKI